MNWRKFWTQTAIIVAAILLLVVLNALSNQKNWGQNTDSGAMVDDPRR